MQTHTFLSPGKINRFLRIVRQEPNGYHYLQTIFQFIDLCDQIHFTLRDDDELVADYHNEIITKENDLILKAIVALKTYAQETRKNIHCSGVSISLDKQLPTGAGLGGGSSNAATALIAMNRLWNLNFTNEQLQMIGRKLGADVPIFIYGKSAWAEGIGDQFTPLSPPEESLVLIVPPISISTQKIFTSEVLERSHDKLNIDVHTPYVNDCTSAIFKLYPEMKKLINDLENASFLPKITGTGACLFFSVLENQLKLLEEICKQHKCTYTQFKSLNRSPMYSSLDSAHPLTE